MVVASHARCIADADGVTEVLAQVFTQFAHQAGLELANTFARDAELVA